MKKSLYFSVISIFTNSEELSARGAEKNVKIYKVIIIFLPAK